jgi:hypothetical protein
MTERMLKFRTVFTVLCSAALILVLGACGSDSGGAVASNGSPNEVGGTAGSEDLQEKQVDFKERKRLLSGTIAKLDRRSKACEILSDRFLRDNYGASGESGRQRCQAVLEGRPPRKVRSYRIVHFKPQRAQVLVVDSTSSKALTTFVYTGGKWLLDDARSPGPLDRA